MIEIVPNWHPIWVHFAIGLTVSGAVFYAIGWLRSRGGALSSLVAAGRWNLLVGAGFVLIALVSGFLAINAVPHDDLAHANALVHRNWAVASAVLFTGLGIWLAIRGAGAAPSGLLAALALIASAAIGVTGYKGGQNVYEHGLGVQRLPDIGGHDHSAHGHGGSDTAMSSEDATESGHDHEAHDHGSPSEAMSDEGVPDDHGDHDHDAPKQAEATEEAANDHSSHDHGESARTGGPQRDTGEIAQIAGALKDALASRDEAAVRELLASDVLIFEGGGAERSLEEYAGHHMGADMQFLAAIDHELLERAVFQAGDMAAIASRSRLTGAYRGQSVDLTSSETLVLRRDDDGNWKISHIHWSSQ